ncbi:hypothetical protein GH714_024933 [Hevea brasiliensis]|uniref:Uncharacterized protein n=1 Tax=Hevea brasiliensis TaxID=3981 RepID=A0A6A6MCX4_HEVBR|nr:hypothetical protein GH714_024933 [Hevea brasiliensis]
MVASQFQLVSAVFARLEAQDLASTIVALASGLSAILIYITGVSSNLNAIHQLSHEDVEALESLQSSFRKCVNANGLGLRAVSGSDHCQVIINFPSDTVPKWRDPKTGELEGLSFEFNLCEAVATWEQVRNSTTILTREFIDALPNGWEDYAWRRINKGILLQFDRCAVIGNSGDLLKTRFGKEIDGYDAVVRENGAPIQNYTEYVGKKSTFRLLNRGSAKALDKVVELDETKKEALIIKTTIHDIMNKMIRDVPINNPVYLMLGASFGSAAKGTGLKALEFALSICESVDMYGFTVDPGYKEWTRYFSESRQGHTPLHGRAYYQMMECLGEGQLNGGSSAVERVGPPIAVTSFETVGSKRQRRPSVRLGEIGGEQLYDAHSRRTANNKQWKHHQLLSLDHKKDPSTSNKGSKTRALTNLTTSGEFAETLDEDKEVNLDTVAIGSWRVKDSKKRASTATTKRVRSNWVSKIEDAGGGGANNNVEGDEKYSGGEDVDDAYRGFDMENSESPLKEQSPIHSSRIWETGTREMRGKFITIDGQSEQGIITIIITMGLNYRVHRILTPEITGTMGGMVVEERMG